MSRRFGWLLIVLLLLAGCRMPASQPLAPSVGSMLESREVVAPPLTGKVDFDGRRVQVALPDVGKAATVSLINTGTNRTEATTVTNDAGQFVLTFRSTFQPDPTATYYLEAIKGLNSNLPGRDLARVRTIAKFQGGTWVTVTAGSDIVLGRSSTALSIGAALKAGTASPVDFNALIGSVTVGTPDTYHPVTNLSQTDYNSLYALVDQTLVADEDPVAGIGYDASTGTWKRIPQIGLSVMGITPASASVGTSVTLSGSAFGATTGENTVRFNGVAGTVTIASATSLTVTVPSGATSGQTTVQVGNLIALGPNFQVNVAVSAFTPTGGYPGTDVTITGSGFSATPGENTVKFNGVAGTVTSASATSLTVTAPDSTTGPISVSVAGVTGTSASNFNFGPPRLLTLFDPVMNSGNLTLEGAFGSTVQVNFPGGVSVPATVLGSNQATVSVPTGATAGNLTVTTKGSTSNALPFRRTSFTPGLFQFNSRYEDQARPLPSLGTAYYGSAGRVIGNYLYVIGGGNGSGSTTSVVRAVINADGTIGAFSGAGVWLMTGRYSHTTEVIGNYLYVIGGCAAGSTNSVERATINPDGTLGTFSTVSGVTLMTPRHQHTSAVIGNYLYVFGGINGLTSLNSVERAAINPDGTIGNFSTVSGASLVTARNSHTSAVIGNYVYIVAGTNGGNLSSVERATINPDGTLGTFSTVPGVSLVAARSGHVSVSFGNYLYVVGGSNNGAERAAINPDGTLGAFSTVTGVSLGVRRYYAASAVVGNHLYVIAGTNGMGTILNTIERAAITPDGTLGAFSTMAGSLLTPRAYQTSAVIGNSLYVIGGYDGSNYLSSVERAAIAPDGTLGTFSTMAGSLLTPRAYLTSAVIGNYLYVIGGYDGSNYLSSVERAAINPDGTLGSFTDAGVALATARRTHTSTVIGNYLYVIGGYDGSNYLSSVERAAINPDGTLGSFTDAGVALATARRTHTSAVIGNYLYVIGGWNGSVPLSSVERATINSDGTISTFTAVGTTLVAARYSHSSTVIGNYLYLVGGADNSGYLSSVERVAINTDGTLGTFSTVPGVSLVTARANYSSSVLGNYLYLLGGYNGSTMSSIERATLQ